MRSRAPSSKRKNKTHKNDYGHVLIIAGSKPMVGAGCLSALAALRSGAGMVTLALPESLNDIAQKKLASSIMTLPLKETKHATIAYDAQKQIVPFFDKYKAVGIGPGLGTDPSTKKFVLKIIEKCPIPLVIDADALNIVAEYPGILEGTKNVKILTPHPGEMHRLCKKPVDEIEKHRNKVTEELALQTNSIVLLKGPKTVVFAPPKSLYVNKTGNPGMATAGSGDCLTGVITAFLSQGATGFEAAKYGAYFHGLAGDMAVEKIGQRSLIADDIVEYLPAAFQKSSR